MAIPQQLIQRPKTYQDDAIPNGNGIAAYTLARLGYLVGDTRYLTAAERVLEICHIFIVSLKSKNERASIYKPPS